MEINIEFIQPGINNTRIDCATRVLKALAHPLRIKILNIINMREVNVSDITIDLAASQSNISQHLSILKNCGVLMSRKSSNHVFYRIEDIRILHIISMIKDVYDNE